MSAVAFISAFTVIQWKKNKKKRFPIVKETDQSTQGVMFIMWMY